MHRDSSHIHPPLSLSHFLILLHNHKLKTLISKDIKQTKQAEGKKKKKLKILFSLWSTKAVNSKQIPAY